MALDGSVLIVSDDDASRQLLAQALAPAGFQCVSVDSGNDALAWLAHSTPAVMLLDLPPSELDGANLLPRIRSVQRLREVPIILTVAEPGEGVDRVITAGADDYIVKPFRPAELTARVRAQLRLHDYWERLNRRERDSRTVLELTQTLALTLDVSDILFTVAKRVAEFARVDRCSIVLRGDAAERGYVVATSDDEQLRHLPIDLDRYPEIAQVLSTGQPLSIADAGQHPLLQVVREQESELEFTSLVLVPILQEKRPMGVIFLRSRSVAVCSEYEMALVQTVANATAIALRNARILQSLRDETQQSTFARVEAERRVQLFQRYADFFESAADGMIVIDQHGRVLFANPRAREITGFSETELVGLPLRDLFVAEEGECTERLLRGFSEGVYPRGVDVRVRTGLGPPIIISVSFSSVLHGERAVLFSFREVTQERKTAVELRQTKEFLERVIESSVDGIISADLDGKILIFNRAACRIFGYTAAEVIGRLTMERLYPPGVAEEVARRIQDPRAGAHGHIEDLRLDMVHVTGERIPVVLSASLIMEADRPVGSVGIVTDMREKLRMEARLQRAQEELRAREKQAIVAELAGGAAHELNQPLTSVLNYAELLARNLEEGTSLHRAARVIITESERMAEMVRKIGKITRYETRDYVGGQRILDLEKASEEGGHGPPR